jgi:chemotaxis protein MotB
MANKPKVEKDNAERYLLTYADLMNLLLILFIILYTMSKVDTTKYEQLSQSLRSAMGISAGDKMLPQGGSGNSVVNLPQNSGQTNQGEGTIGTSEEQQLASLEKKVEEIIKLEGLQGDVIVTIQERGVVISIRDKILFLSGSAELDQSARATIISIGKALLTIAGKQIRVEGHTDTDPMYSSRYPDNQELSTARANSVLRILVTGAGLDPKVMSAAGYGEFRPVAPNNTPENKAKNRRVDITILKDKFDDSAESITY